MTLKIVAVFPEGGDAAKNEKYVNCTENALGLRDWCKQNDADLVVTSSKDGSDSGEGMHRPWAMSTFMYSMPRPASFIIVKLRSAPTGQAHVACPC